MQVTGFRITNYSHMKGCWSTTYMGHTKRAL